MAIVGTMKKQPREIVPFVLSYTTVLDGRTATSITPTVEMPAGLVSTSEEVIGEYLQCFVSGGLDGETYLITVLTDLVVGGKTIRVEDEIKVKVKEVSLSVSP